MKLLVTFGFFLLIIFMVSGKQRNEKCKTPLRKPGTCTPLSLCNPIRPIILAARHGNATLRRFALAHQCGHDTEVLVCCSVEENYTKFLPPPPQTPIVLKDFNTTDLPDRSICGVSEDDLNKLFGGQRTTPDEYPWMAALEYVRRKDNTDAGIKCAGSLINNRYVMTAAHCILHKEFKISKVRLGEWDLTKNPDCYNLDKEVVVCADEVQLFDVEKEIPHEYYTTRDSNHDIGLIKLSRNVSYSTYIRPICLPPKGLPPAQLNSQMVVAGWGMTEDGAISNTKLQVSLPIVSNRVCKDKMLTRMVSKNHYCAGGMLDKGACQGDSGGPLMRMFLANDEERWYLEGIVGSGVGCGRSGSPGVYVRVTEYVQWILSKLAEERKRENLINQV